MSGSSRGSFTISVTRPSLCTTFPARTSDAGKELIDVGACCPTIFTTGNLANYLKAKVAAEGRQEVAK